MKLEFHIVQEPAFRDVRIYLTKIGVNGERLLAKPLELEFAPLKESTIYPEPTLRFNYVEGPQVLPALADALARAGYKSESSDAGELKATKIHLEDMRKLALEPQIVNITHVDDQREKKVKTYD